MGAISKIKKLARSDLFWLGIVLCGMIAVGSVVALDFLQTVSMSFEVLMVTAAVLMAVASGQAHITAKRQREGHRREILDRLVTIERRIIKLQTGTGTLLTKTELESPPKTSK